jgi:hypothetical protein
MLKIFTALAIVAVCRGFERDEKFVNNENETIASVFMRTMRISDFKQPNVDNLGECCATVVNETELKAFSRIH